MCFDIERNSQLICHLREIYKTIAGPIPSKICQNNEIPVQNRNDTLLKNVM